MRERPGTELGYRPALDGLRAIAVLSVVAVHYAGEWRWLIPGGGLGVNIFFVMSGFLITRLMLEEVRATGSFRVRAFYRRRAARLIPALALMVGSVLILEFAFGLWGEPGAIATGAVTSVLYVHNWARFVGMADPAFGFTWSLAVEEQFYLVWPLVFVVGYRRFGRVGIQWISGGLAIFGTFEAIVRSIVFDHTSDQLKNGTDTNGMIGLMVGCFVAATITLEPIEGSGAARLRGAGWVALAALAAAMVVGDPTGNFHVRGGYLLVSIATALVVVALVRDALNLQVLTAPPVVWVGKASYGIYLFHLPLLTLAYELTDGRPALARGLGLAATFGGAWLSLRWVERPLRARYAVKQKRSGRRIDARTPVAEAVVLN